MFVTAEEQGQMKDLVERARGDGNRVVTVPDSTRQELRSSSDIEGEEIRDVELFQEEWKDSFEFEWVDESDLTERESEAWGLKDEVLSLVGVGHLIEEVRISETMRSLDDGWKALGLWEPAERRIVIKRGVLNSKSGFIGILLHEAAHAKGGATDQTREFEGALTDLLGITGTAAALDADELPQKDLNPVSDS